MIYYTGDIHGSADALVRFCINKNLQQKDVVILLGDVGANYHRMYVIEKSFKNKDEVFLDMENFKKSQDVEFRYVLNDIFGDG